MRVFQAEIHFKGSKTHLVFSIVSKDKKSARTGALEVIQKQKAYKDKVIDFESWQSKKVQGQDENWGRVTVVWNARL